MSTYSTNLKLTLIGTGEQAGTWGTTTNTNLGTLIEQAIVGYETQVVADSSSATVLTIPNATSSTGRNYVIEFTGTLTAARTVEVPAVDKPYIFFNNTTGGYAVTVKVSGQTGVSIANGAKLICYVNSTDVIKVLSTVNDFLSYVAPSTSGNILTSNGSAWVSAPPVQTGVTGLSFGSTGLTPATTTTGSITVAGTLAVANGGTGQTTASAAFNALSPITTRGDLIVGSSSNTATRLGVGPANYVLTSDGTTVGWQPTGGFSGPVTSVASSFTGGVISVSGSPITSVGTLAFTVAGTSGGIPYFSSSSTWTSSAALTQYALVLGGGAGAAPTPLASLGTSTTVLHGNASGAPTFGAVSLTADVSGALPAANGGTGLVSPGASGNVLTSDGTGWTSATPATAISLSANNTWTGTQTFNGTSAILATVLVNAAETMTISATAATGTIAYNVTTQSVLYYTSNASANWTVNFRASSGTSLNTAMSTGQSITVAFLVTQGATAYYNSAVQVDGSSVTPKWQGGTAPTAGNASSVDIYVYTIVKTGSAAFTVFASQTKFA